jgi:hypothetical protein
VTLLDHPASCCYSGLVTGCVPFLLGPDGTSMVILVTVVARKQNTKRIDSLEISSNVGNKHYVVIQSHLFI